MVDLQAKGYYDVIGVDLSVVRILRNRERVRKLYFGSSEHLPVDSESSDSVICIECLEHCMNVEKTLSEIQRALKPGGKAFFQVPNEYRIDCEWHLRIFSSATLKALVSRYLNIQNIEIIPYLFGEKNNSIYVVAEKRFIS
jgi:ubiquinone/menaquinone biosynthesis C-methylase UbiE